MVAKKIPPEAPEGLLGPGDTPVPDPAVKAVKEAIVLQIAKNHLEDVSRYAVQGVYNDWDKAGIHQIKGHTGACHSTLSRYSKIEALCTAPVVRAWRDADAWGANRQSRDCTAHFQDSWGKFSRWWEYLMNTSVWAPVFLEKSLEVAERDGVLINLDVPNNYAMQGIIGTRLPHEFPNTVELWDDIVQAGGDPELSCIIMEAFNKKVIKINDTKAVIMSPRSSSGDIHDMFDYRDMGILDLKRYIIRRQHRPNKTFREDGKFSGIHALWGTRRVGGGSVVCEIQEGLPLGTVVKTEQFCVMTKKTLKKTEEVCLWQDGVQYLAEESVKLRRRLDE